VRVPWRSAARQYQRERASGPDMDRQVEENMWDDEPEEVG
jgi:hypothetical protein